ncbi:chlorohydrolase [Streptococcus pneumoniae]|nr:chlorohydrolase [Streptococcus pneumoniae]
MTQYPFFILKIILNEIKEQTRKLLQNTVLRLWIELTESVSYTYGKATLTRFEEIFEEY